MSVDDHDDISTESVKGTYTGLHDCETVDIRRTPENLDDLPVLRGGGRMLRVSGDRGRSQLRADPVRHVAMRGGHRRCAGDDVSVLARHAAVRVRGRVTADRGELRQ